MTLPPIDQTHDIALKCWVAGADGHADFPVQNLPYGIFSSGDGAARPGAAVGDHVLDLGACAELLPEEARAALSGVTLNALFALSAADRLALRRRLSALLTDEAHRAATQPLLIPMRDCTMHLPAAIGDYTDFFVGIHHALNVGKQFRPDNPLLPNYKYVPIGYHGRASSIRPSGVPMVRPNGQRKAPDQDAPSFGPSRRLDYELEMGVWIGTGNALGTMVPIGEAADHIAGFCLLNDWSARDLQAWEYQPLGPFMAKNFHSTVSPWVITPEALAPFRIAQPPRAPADPAPLPYLFDEGDQRTGAFAITLQASLLTAAMRAAKLPPYRLGRGPASNMYWTVAQIVTHHASSGCNLRTGDLLGTGTISTATDDGLGSLLELARGGAAPIGFGEARALVLPAPAC